MVLSAVLRETRAMTHINKIVIVGGSLAGLRAAQTLRDSGFAGDLVVVSGEAHLPYDRPPLSKQVLSGAWEPAQAELEPEEAVLALGDWRFNTLATGLDVAENEVSLSSGERIAYDRLLIATGASPISLPGTPALAGIHTLRTLDDAIAIRSAMESGARVAIVGGGFIGCEVAAASRGYGLETTIIEGLETPLQRVLGREVGDAFGRLHTARGVDLRCGASVTGFEGGSRVEAVRLADGSSIAADLVVVGVGARPNVSWLAQSGLELGNGVVCDEFCRTSDPDVFAAGDCASWFNPRYGRAMRIEHWTNAVEQGMTAAANMLAEGDLESFAPVPYVWSDQYDVSARFAGYNVDYDEVRVVRGDLAKMEAVVLYRMGDRLAAVLSVGMGRVFTRYQRFLQKDPTWDEGLAFDPGI